VAPLVSVLVSVVPLWLRFPRPAEGWSVGRGGVVVHRAHGASRRGLPARLGSLRCVSHDPKAGRRRLVDMSPDIGVVPWAPPRPPQAALEYEQTFPIGEDVEWVQRIGYDELGRVADWAVVQKRRVSGAWRRVAVYDACHGKGMHVHLYDRSEAIIVALPDDTMGYVFDRLRDAGGAAALAVLDGDQVWSIAIMWPASAARREVAREDDSVTQIHRNSRADMFMAYLERTRTVVVVQYVAARLVDQGELQLT
jgi:hypothetical protein